MDSEKVGGRREVATSRSWWVVMEVLIRRTRER